MKRNWCLLCVMILLLCAGCGGNRQRCPPEQERPLPMNRSRLRRRRSGWRSTLTREITITVPASYEDLVLVDNIGSDNMFVVTANLYYAPAYIASEDGCTPPLCGGWMLTVEWADSQYAASVYQDGETFYATCWRPDQQSVYMEQRPAAAELPADAPEEFLAVMESIGGLRRPVALYGGGRGRIRLNTAARKRFGGIPCPENSPPGDCRAQSHQDLSKIPVESFCRRSEAV